MKQGIRHRGPGLGKRPKQPKMPLSPGFSRASKVNPSYHKTSVCLHFFLLAGIGGKGGERDIEGGMGGGGGSTHFKLSPEANYEFSGIEGETYMCAFLSGFSADRAVTVGTGGDGGRGRVKGGRGGSGGDFSVV